MNRNDKEFMIRRIRTQYTAQTETSVDELRALDRRVRRPADIFGFVFGAVGALIAGTGMSLILSPLGADLTAVQSMVLCILFGALGLCGIVAAYPLYHRVVAYGRKKIAPQILRLTDELSHETEKFSSDTEKHLSGTEEV